MTIQSVAKPKANSDQDLDDIPVTSEERRTSELVIGLVGPVGSGVSTTSAKLKEILENDFGYEVVIIKVSDIVNEKAHLVGKVTVLASDDQRIAKLQETGSALRKKLGEDVLANFCIEKIHIGRGGNDVENVRRYCTIIDSLKNPREVERLRAVYGDLFWLIGVFAPEDVRVSRLKADTPNSAYIHKITDQDYDEGTEHGQSVKDTMTMADMFIRNDADNDVKLRKVVKIFLDRLFGIGVDTPSSEETAMFAAASIALKSACLSRQVGAVLQNENGEVIGQGANDVPKFNGGLYSSDLSKENDHRCYNWRGHICHNDAEKDIIFEQIAKIARTNFENASEKDLSSFLKELRKSRIKGLIEFSRAVHAEMAAIVSAARNGSGRVCGATLFTTTFPCHNCARHIVAAGITKVVYIEPYPKSLALKLHNDAISTKESDKDSKVLFLQYEGAAPQSFVRLFKQNPVRKDNGKLLERSQRDAMPISAPPVDSLFSRELIELGRLLREVDNVKSTN
jgi:deoxycytidylate deaminase